MNSMPDEVLSDSLGVLLMRRKSDGALYFAMDDYTADQCFESREEAQRFLTDLRDRMAKRVLTILGDADQRQSRPAQWPKVINAEASSVPESNR